MKKNKPYCLMPWIHLHIAHQGLAKACCVAPIPYGNINEQSLEEIWNGEEINKLRNKFLSGEQDSRCAVCIQLEAGGGKSIRQETFEKFPDIIPTENCSSVPIYFDIRFSNICNFRCRTCWHGASSKWFMDAKALGRTQAQQAIIKNIDDFNDFIEKTGQALLQAEEIYFAGGEPLVTEEHYLLLEWLLAHKANRIRLRYNTNFSKLQFRQYDALHLWKEFSSVEILASIDAAAALGEYIRKDLVWADILKNRLAIQILKHVQFKIAPTVSILNMQDLPNLYQTCLKLNLIEQEDIYINILERPLYYNIQAFPASYKERIQTQYHAFFEWMKDQQIPASVRLKFEECLSYMFAKDRSKHWNKFLQETQQLDELRSENISDFKSFQDLSSS